MFWRSWVQFPSGTEIFSLSHACDMMNISSFIIFYVTFFRVFGLPADFKEGVVFSTYATLVSSVQKGKLNTDCSDCIYLTVIY